LSGLSPKGGSRRDQGGPPAFAQWRLADTHCHLNSAAFGSDLEQVLKRARQSGVVRVLVPGVDLESSRAAVELAGKVEEIYAAIGIHPHAASELNCGALACLRELSRIGKVAAVGEIGLDYHRDLPDRGIQRRSFQEQLDLAGELDLPIVVHLRDSVEETLGTLQEWAESRGLGSIRGVFHAYEGSSKVAGFAQRWGLYLGIGGIFTYPKAEALRDSVRTPSADSGVALEKLLLETDAPYLPPQGHRGQRNEPAFLVSVADRIGRELGIPADRVGQVTRGNAQQLFHWE
jgi:TatD DNase family protein